MARVRVRVQAYEPRTVRETMQAVAEDMGQEIAALVDYAENTRVNLIRTERDITVKQAELDAWLAAMPDV